jgi:hypothetical protein
LNGLYVKIQHPSLHFLSGHFLIPENPCNPGINFGLSNENPILREIFPKHFLAITKNDPAEESATGSLHWLSVVTDD